MGQVQADEARGRDAVVTDEAEARAIISAVPHPHKAKTPSLGPNFLASQRNVSNPLPAIPHVVFCVYTMTH